MKYRVTLTLLLCLSIFLPVMGQTKPAGDQDDVVKITTNLVQIDAVVTKDGKPVVDLKAEDFELYEDGKKQTITSFAYIFNVPSARNAGSPTAAPTTVVPFGPVQRDAARRTIAIVVDDLGLSAESIYQVKRQVRKFIATELQPNDLVAVIRTGGEMGTLQQFTNDKRLLNRAVDQLRWNVRSRVGMSVIPRVGDMATASANRLGNQEITLIALRFVLDAMGRLPGRKSMILMSDSLPVQEQNQVFEGSHSVTIDPNLTSYTDVLQRIAEKAIRSSVVIYSVDTQGLQYTVPTAADSIRSSAQALGPQTNALINNRSRLLYERRQGGEIIARQTGGSRFATRTTSGSIASWKIRAVITCSATGLPAKLSTGDFITSKRR